MVGAVALVTYALHGFNGLLSRDLALYSYAGQQVAEGVPPYLGVMNRAGPLAHVIPAVGVVVARLGGWDDLLTMRVVFMIIATVSTCAVYALGRDTFRSRVAGIVGAGTFLTFAGFIHYASDGPREKTPMTLFVVCALWAVSRRRWFTAGVFVGLATLCLQIAFFPTFSAVATGALLLARGHRVRAVASVALGGALPSAACALYFASTGSLRQAVEAFLLVNARYTEPDPLLPKLGESVRDSLTAYGPSVWLIALGSVSLIVLPLVLVRDRDQGTSSSAPVLAALASALVVGLLWDLKDYDAWPDLFPLLPLAAVGVAGLFVWATHRLGQTLTLVAAVAVCLAATGTAVYESVTTRDDRLVAQRESVSAVFDQLPPDATITSIEAPQPLVIARKTNPTRYQMFSGGMQRYVDDVWPGGLRGFRQRLIDRPTTLLAVGDTMSSAWREGIVPRYAYIGRAPGWYWFARRSLGHDRLAALRDAATAGSTEGGHRSAPRGAHPE
jgi:hypothetical protein